MDHERAETCLRLLAEAGLRRAAVIAAGSLPAWWRSTGLELAAQALRVAGAVGSGVADEIQADLGLAIAGRYRRSFHRVGRPGCEAMPQRASRRTRSAGLMSPAPSKPPPASIWADRSRAPMSQ